MDYKERLVDWLSWCDKETQEELSAITDENELEDRFYKDLEFGTAGLRGVMGAGPNRMNSYTVARATKGFAYYLHEKYAGEISRGVVIAYDSRNHSRDFAREAAGVLMAAGIPVYLFHELAPIPVLSFSVKYFRALGGIVITASHNPPEYNGYKVYGENGGQLVPHDAEILTDCVESVTDLANIPKRADEALLTWLGDETVNLFVETAFRQSIYHGNPPPLSVVYTPIHGSGNKPVRHLLKKAGFTEVSVVPEQELPDGNFPTVRSPNPEDEAALTLAIRLAEKKHADLVIGTDPDADRIGAAVRHDGVFHLISGNQMGALLTDFLLTMKKETLSPASTIIKTIVTGELGADIAREKGVQVVETLTGFKYIGEKISEYAHDPSHDYVFGYEESYGYLAGTHAQDKDAEVTAMLICEMAAYWKSRGKTLIDALLELYKKYGYRLDRMVSYTLKGKEGVEKIRSIMKRLRAGALTRILMGASETLDYETGIGGLPKENVVKIFFTDGSWIAARPSGTEPKIKFYASIKAEGEALAEARLATLRAAWEKEFKLC